MLQFDEHFFREEEREGFVVSEMMKRFWACHMEMLRIIDEICKKHHIRWYMDWGTLLGAVRHKGWIPWDDDMDICLRRADYKKLMEALPKEMPKEYELFSPNHKEEYNDFWGGVCNSARIVGTREFRDAHYGCPFVASIDFFPLDVLPRDKETADTLQSLIAMLWMAGNMATKGEQDAQLKETLQHLEALLDVQFDLEKPLNAQLWSMANLLASSFGEEDGDYYILWTEYMVNDRKKLKKEWFDTTVNLPFEQMQLPAPGNYHDILSVYYGEYMIPVKNAAAHDYPVYKKQMQKLRQVIEQCDEMPE